MSLSPRKRRRRTAWHSSTPRCHCHRSLCPLILLFLLLHTLRSGSGSILTCPRRQRSLGSPTSFSDKRRRRTMCRSSPLRRPFRRSVRPPLILLLPLPLPLLPHTHPPSRSVYCFVLSNGLTVVFFVSFIPPRVCRVASAVPLHRSRSFRVLDLLVQEVHCYENCDVTGVVGL